MSAKTAILDGIGEAKRVFKQVQTTLQSLSRKGRLERELKAYQVIAAQNPDDVRTRFKIAELLFLQRNVDEAVQIYRDIADIYIKQNFALKAIDAYHNILRLAPTDVSSNEKLGELYQKSGMDAEALQQYEIAFYTYRSQGHTEKAIATCEAMTLISADPKHRRKLAEAYQALGRKEDALREFETIAALYRKEKRYDELLEIYKLMLPERREDKTFLRDLAILYLHKKNAQEAVRLLERAKLAHDPDCKTVYDKAKALITEEKTKP